MKDYTLLITPDEAVTLAIHAFAVSYGHAKKIADCSAAAFNKRYGDGDPRFAQLCTIQAIYEAGRIQGIREERRRRKGKGRTA